MKRQFLCKMISFVLAAALVAENNMTVLASQASVYEAQENEETALLGENVFPENQADEEPEGGASEEGTPGVFLEDAGMIQDGAGEDPTEPEVDPTESETDPTEPETDPTEPETDPTEPEVNPTEPEIDPTEPETEPESQTLEAPEIITPVTVSLQGEVSFRWNAVENAEGYHVYRSVSSEGEWQLCDEESVAGPETVTGTLGEQQQFLFTDKTAQLGKAYYYKVCGYVTIEGSETEGDFSQVVDSTVTLQDISFDGTEFSVKKGGTLPLSLNFEPVNATRTEVVWTSSDPEVAVVSEEGTVTAVGEGSAEIQAAVGEKTAVCVVKVLPDRELVLNEQQLTLKKGTAAKLTVVSGADGFPVTWTSSDPAVVSVSEDGIVRALGGGEAVITATAGEISAECSVTVTVAVSKVILEKDSVEIVKGGNSKEIIVNLAPQDATDRTITCKAEDESIVTCNVVDGKVVLTSKTKLGTTTVGITAGGQTAVLTVTVVEEELVIDDKSDRVPVGQVRFIGGNDMPLAESEKIIKLMTGAGNTNTRQLTAEVLPKNATNQNITWESSDRNVAEVSESGLVTATGRGMAQITGKAENGVFDKVTVIVESDIEEVKIDGSGTTLYCNADQEVFAGRTLFNTYQVRMTDTSLVCTYRSSNEKVATVDEKGLVTAVAPGEAYVVALNVESGKSDAILVKVERLVEKIELPVSETKVVAGTEMKLEASVYEEEATNKKYKWKTSDTTVANIDSGIMIAKKKGTVTITATAEDAGKISASMTIHIVDPSENAVAGKVSLSYTGKSSATIKSGTEISLVTAVKDQQNNDLALEDEFGQPQKYIAYKSSDEKVAVVDETGKVTAIAGGKAKITATVMDGSNVSGSFSLTVEQRPEEIAFSRGEYLVAPGKSVTLKPTILPANSKEKKVTWSLQQILDSEGNAIAQTATQTLIKVSTAGKVTIASGTPIGTTAVIRCTSKAYDEKTETPVYTDVVVRVGKTSVTKLTMKKKSLDLAGIGTEETLEFTAKGADASTFYTWTSDKEDVVTVDENGKVTVIGYGTAKVTLCADNAIEASCTISANPIKKGEKIAAVSGSYGIEQADNDGNGYVQLYFINQSTKSVLDADLFTFTSSDPGVVYVDENGIAYANPKAEITGDTTVTITAALKDDPYKRKATTKVTVWKEKQVKNIEFRYWGINKNEVENFNDKAEEEYKQNGELKIKAIAYDAEHVEMKNASLIFSVSDSSLADIAVDETDKTGHTLIITVKKPGRFYITCMANDNMHRSRKVTFGIYSGTPILKETSLGTVNKKGTIEEVSGSSVPLIFSDSSFTLTGANGTMVSGVSVQSARILNEDGTYSSIAGTKFRVIHEKDDQYRLAVSKEELASAKTGTYEITLTAERSSMSIENNADLAREEVKTSFKITNSTPSIKIANVTVNSFERGTWTKLKITTNAEIEDLIAAPEGELAQLYDIEEKQDGWYIAIKDSKFDSFTSTKKTQGSFKVSLKGYEEPVSVSATVTAKSTKPSLKQLNIPDILTKQGDTAEITIYDNTAKENLTGYRVSVSVKKESDKKWDVVSEDVTDQIQVRLENPTVNKAVSYKQTVVIEKDEWRDSVSLNLTVKASPESAKPTVSFEKTSFTLNTIAEAETYTTAVKTNKSNVTFRNGEWQFVNAEYANLFTAMYEDGNLTIGLNPEAVEKGRITATQYKLQFTDVFNEAGYETVKTGTLKVTIKRSMPTIGTIKFSGKLDLVNRHNSTLTGTVSVSGLSAEIDTINLCNGEDTGFTENFYCVQNKNKFTIYARSTADLSVTTYKGKVNVTLKNGTQLQKDISFKTSQAAPKLKAMPTQTIYKSEESRIADYDLNTGMPDGVQINDIVTRVLPAGLGVEYDKGHAYVVVNDDTLKQGTYTIGADVYFKGAQRVDDSELGTPVRMNFKVTIKE